MTLALPRGLGYKPGKPDPRDRAMATRLKDAPIAANTDLWPLVGDVLDQGQLGSCTANGWAKLLQMDLRRQGVVDPPLPARLPIYYLEREIEGSINDDAGAEIRDGGKATARWGFASEALCPYSDVSDGPDAPFRLPPPWPWFRAAADLRDAAGAAHEYEAITVAGPDRLTQIRQALTAGHAVVFGTQVSNDFCRGILDPVAEPPPDASAWAGGHCLLAIGHDDTGRFKILNSWSADFGQGGWCWFSSEYMAASFTGDLWIAQVVPRYLDAARRAGVLS